MVALGPTALFWAVVAAAALLTTTSIEVRFHAIRHGLKVFIASASSKANRSGPAQW